MCAQRRLKLASATAQSIQSLPCPHKEILHPWLSNMRPVKILIRLHHAQADLNLFWAHMSAGVFSDVATQMPFAMYCVVQSEILANAKLAQQTYNVATTSLQRRCNVVVTTLCVGWEIMQDTFKGKFIKIDKKAFQTLLSLELIFQCACPVL